MINDKSSKFFVRNLLLILLVALVYFLSARMGLLLAFEKTNSTPVWPPSGIVFAMFLLFGYRVWSGVTIGAFAINVFVFLSNKACDLPTALWVSALVSIGNTLEGLAGYYVLKNFVDPRYVFQKATNVFLFVLTTLLMCSVSAAIGPAVICISKIAEWSNYSAIWFTWWMGDVAGILVVTPLIVIWTKSFFIKWTWRKTAEAGILLTMIFFVSGIIFSDWASRYFLFSQSYLIIPLLLWAALRFEAREVVTAIVISTAIAVWETINGHGPFAVDSLNISLLSLQGYVSVLSITFLTLSLALDERKQTETALKAAHQKLNTVLKEQTSELKISKNEVGEYQKRIDGLLEVLLEYSQFNFTREALIGEKRDELDAIAAGLNALGQELNANIRALKESEAKLSAAQQLAHIGSWEWDLSTNELNWSDELYRIHGLNPGEKNITYEKSFQLVHNVDKTYVSNIIAESKRTLKPFNFFYRIVLNDNTIRTLHARGEVMADEKNRPVKMVGIDQDVTERLKEEELEKLAVAATKSFNSVVIANREGKIEWVNEGFTKLTGYTLDEVKHTHGEILRKGASTGLSSQMNPYETVMKEKEPISYENTNYSKDGREHWLITTLTPVLDKDGEVERIISIDVDITLRKQMEGELISANKIAEHSLMKGNKALDELLKAKRELEESMKVKEQFLANMSHEIRTPMNAIVGFTDLIAKTAISTEQKQYIDAIKTSGENLIVIINDILDFSKIQSGKISFEHINFKLSQVMSTVTEMMLPKSVEKNIALSATLDEKIHDHLIGDPTRLNQILLNLVDNAIKFTEHGEIKTTVEIISENDNEVEFKFSVKDTGIGIPEKKLDSIFDEFTQATSDTTRKYGGSGLGLTIVKQLVELQGGTISVESNVNSGSTFSFTLKFKKNNTVAGLGMENKSPYENKQSVVEGLNVLLVEDNKLNQVLAKKVLTDWSWNVELAENGVVAIKKLKEKDFDIILMDIQLPEMDGYEATRVIRKELTHPKCNTPIMAMTAHAFSSEEEKCRIAGMNGYISKPFDQKNLYAKIISIVTNTTKNNPKEVPAEKKEKQKKMKHINLDYLKELSNGSNEFVAEMISLFIEQTPEAIENMEKYLKSKDWKSLRGVAHKMKPSITFVGLKEIENTVRIIENSAAEESGLDALPQMISEIKQVCTEAIEELQAELKQFA